MAKNIFSGWKKFSTNGKNTIMAHPNGHKMIIQHKHLKPEHLEQLHSLPFAMAAEKPAKGVRSLPKLADGGKVSQGDDIPEAPKKNAQQMQQGATSGSPSASEAWGNLKSGLGFAEGGAVSKGKRPKGRWKWMAEGGEVAEEIPGDPAPSPQPDVDPELQKKREFYNHETSVPTGRGFVPAPDKQFGPNGEAPQTFDAAAAARADEDYTKAQQNDADAQQQAAIAAQADNKGRQSMGLAPLPGPMAQAAAQQNPALQGQVAQATKASPNDPYGTQAFSDAYSKGIGEQKQGMSQEAAAQQRMGDAEAQRLATAQDTQQHTLQDYQTHYQNLDNERQSLIKDINNQHIDPNHYLGDMDTASRISTAVGLIAGGIGGAITHQGNPALTYLNSQIDRDIEAQKANLGKSENLLSANMKQFQNSRDATDMTRVMQNDILSNQMKQEAAKATGPLAKARLLEAAGALDAQSAPIMSQIAMRKTLLSGMASGHIAPEQVVRAIVPEKEQEPMYKELKSAQSMAKGRDNLLAAFDSLKTLDTVGNRAMSPFQTPKQVNAIKEPLLAQLVKDSEGRITPQDTKMIDAFFPAYGDSAQTQAIKRAQMNKFISEKMNFPQLKAYGIDVSQSGRFNDKGKSRIPESAPNFNQ